jgi:hypothetical protein
VPARVRLEGTWGRLGTDGTLTVAVPSFDEPDGVVVVETTMELSRAGTALWLDAVFTWSKWRRG